MDAEVGLQVWEYSQQDWLPENQFIAVAKTDADGRFSITVPASADPNKLLGTVPGNR